MSVPAEDETSDSGSAWVSDLSLCDGALEFAGALSSGSGCESGLPKQTSMTSPSTTMGSSSSASPSSVMSAKCRVRPSRTASVRFGSSDVTISIPPASSLVAGLTCVRLHFCKQFRMCTKTVSFRPGFGFFTQDAYARSTPSLGSILPSVYEDGFSSHQYPLWLPLSTVGCCRHRSSAGGDYAPMGGCHSHSLASPHLVSGVLSDRVGVDEIVFEQT